MKIWNDHVSNVTHAGVSVPKTHPRYQEIIAEIARGDAVLSPPQPLEVATPATTLKELVAVMLEVLDDSAKAGRAVSPKGTALLAAKKKT